MEDTNVSGQRLISLILLISLAYTAATISGQKIKRIGVQKYVGRIKESGRTVRRHSSFYIGLYGSNWVNFMENSYELVAELMTLTPNKRKYYQQGQRAMRLISPLLEEPKSITYNHVLILFDKTGLTYTTVLKRKSKSHYFVRVTYPRTIFSLFYPLFLLNRAVLRRIVLRLTTASRHGDDEIVVLTNLPTKDASAQQVMQLYKERWQVERLFLTVTQNFEGEINTLAYPKAALFSFALAIVAYNLLATLISALASVHGVGKIDASLSDFYVVDEIHSTYRGMMIAIPPTAWLCFGDLALPGFALLLQDLAQKVYHNTFSQTAPNRKEKEAASGQRSEASSRLYCQTFIWRLNNI